MIIALVFWNTIIWISWVYIADIAWPRGGRIVSSSVENISLVNHGWT